MLINKEIIPAEKKVKTEIIILGFYNIRLRPKRFDQTNFLFFVF